MKKKQRKASPKDEKNTYLSNKSEGNLFFITEKKEAIVEKSQDELMESLLVRIQKDRSVVGQLHNVLDGIDDDQNK